jgi:hypothetical protein
MDELEFLLKFFRLSAISNSYGSFFWNFDEDNKLRILANCNDLFFWGSSDCEELNPENIDVFEKAIEDMKSISGSIYRSVELFCSRVREERPQGAYYKYLNKEEAVLFDACGPEREIGLGNPKKNIPGR